MPIEAKNPVVQPATEEAVYDKLWVKRFVIRGDDLNGDPRIGAVLLPYRELPGGLKEGAVGAEVTMELDGLYANAEFDKAQLEKLNAVLAKASEKQLIGLALTATLAAIERVAKGRALI